MKATCPFCSLIRDLSGFSLQFFLLLHKTCGFTFFSLFFCFCIILQQVLFFIFLFLSEKASIHAYSKHQALHIVKKYQTHAVIVDMLQEIFNKRHFMMSCTAAGFSPCFDTVLQIILCDAVTMHKC